MKRSVFGKSSVSVWLYWGIVVYLSLWGWGYAQVEGKIWLRKGVGVEGIINYRQGKWECQGNVFSNEEVARIIFGNISPSPLPSFVENIVLRDGTILIGVTKSWRVGLSVRFSLWEGGEIDIPLGEIVKIYCHSLPRDVITNLTPIEKGVRVFLRDGQVIEGQLVVLTSMFIEIQNRNGVKERLNKASLASIYFPSSLLDLRKEEMVTPYFVTEWGAKIRALKWEWDPEKKIYLLQTVWGSYILPVSGIVSIEYDHYKGIPLESLTPTQCVTYSLFGSGTKPVLNEGILWKEFELGKKLFLRGISFCPYTQVRYEIPRGSKLFCGSFGLDNRGVSSSDAKVRVSLDGKEVWGQQLEFQTGFYRLILPIEDQRILSIEVDFGTKGSYGTYVMLIEPIFVQ